MNLREQKKLAAWRTIRAAALRLFDRHGYEAVTVEQIAAAANVSRATFFNYFPSKEAVVFDQDPEERDNWRALMSARPAGEPLWDSLTAIMIGFNERLADRMPLQRSLKARSPALAQSTQELGQQFRADLHDWIAIRAAGTDTMTATLQFNLAFAATSTAYQTWQADETFDEYLVRLRRCLDQAGAGPATTRS
ncbi:AcrR family transcriptional regulator [Catenuloplanes nepalensis]|uniref:AcrR family transcriptional regulator n=1 Tax=Catenuloplanes nepalensis TaxID=587533 RepID=A0ABT9MU13_9ACTN|nr:TetR family transcriptional regulator [Catenuloplanes nepalensis]MDP9794511.1 AcrR family transcriptional regulator [Catenuloplanes nepalensis]